MKKINDSSDMKKDPVLERMLRDRRAPLSADALNRLLTDLTIHIAGDVSFVAALFPKAEAAGKDSPEPSEIARADMMEGTDGEHYLPVFTTMERLKNWKTSLRKGEYLYLMDKKDLLAFLNLNQSLAAAVVNPMDDDLLLYRMILQNMITIAAEGRAA